MNRIAAPDLARRPDLLAAGFTDDELRRLRTVRELVALRPGVYVAAADHRLREPAARHVLAVRAAMHAVGAGSVVSHVSAVVLHGLPVWAIPLDRVHITRDRRSGGRRSRHVHLHAAALEEDDVVMLDGLAVTSLARTAADLARTVPFEQAAVVADAALRSGMPGAELDRSVERSIRRRGNTAARRVAAFADGRAASVGESRSRVKILATGLPPPVLQHAVRSADGAFLGCVDFWWPRHRTVGEFDGRAKYGRLLRPGEEPGDAVFAEKRREDLLRAEGLRVVRWVWDELDRFELVVPRLLRAFESQPRAN